MGVHRNTVSSQVKKSTEVINVNPAYANKGLKMSLKVDEMWPPWNGHMCVKNYNLVGSDGRPLSWVENAVTGEVIAFVLGRRTHQTFRHLMELLEQANIEVIRWITDVG